MKKSEKEKNTTVLGESTEFEGTLQFTDNLRIEGSFKGSIDARGSLHIGAKAQCNVSSIKANDIVVDGYVKGALSANNTVELNPGSKVFGNITATRIKIDDEVAFEGAVRMLPDPEGAKNDLFSSTPQVFKENARTTPPRQ